MAEARVHSFHIPVLGLAFSIDTPLRVARFGISSVVSIVDDVLIEHMRRHYSQVHEEPYTAITPKDEDSRARRITEYLNLMQRIVQKQVAALKSLAFEEKNELTKYFEQLAERSPLHQLYVRMTGTGDAGERAALQAQLRERIVPGDIDVNIMTKLDRQPAVSPGSAPVPDSTDALAALRGFAHSELESSVVLSAGLNLRLFGYLARFEDFLPDASGRLKKKVILKVSDYRSGLIQGKMLAKKGIWISEFRIESGLNCGGHAFASDGYLLGPIMEEFKNGRDALHLELHRLYCAALQGQGRAVPADPLPIRLTVQGGIGTAREDLFLREYYRFDGTGWGSPFLLVPEATNVDDFTRNQLAAARPEDYYLSDTSPLGVPFNNFRDTTSEQLLRRRVLAGKPGSPCTKKFLVSNTEFTKEPICTASRQYQDLKLKQIRGMNLPEAETERRIADVTVKACLCEDLAAPGIINSNENGTAHAVAVCPGPNLAFFSKISTLEEMVGHIYGRLNILNQVPRPHMFINEARLYVSYLEKEIQKRLDSWTAKEEKYYTEFRNNLEEGIAYYHSLIPKLAEETERFREGMRADLEALEEELLAIVFPSVAVPEPVRM